MAVSPKGARVVIEAILKTFAGIPYKWVKPKISNGENGAQESLF